LVTRNVLDRHPGDLGRVVAGDGYAVRRSDLEILDPVGDAAWSGPHYFPHEIPDRHDKARLLGHLASDRLSCGLAGLDPPARQRPPPARGGMTSADQQQAAVTDSDRSDSRYLRHAEERRGSRGIVSCGAVRQQLGVFASFGVFGGRIS
jgi:hypothetical protein